MQNASIRYLCAILAVILALTSLSACSKQKTQDIQNPQPTTESSALPAENTPDVSAEANTESAQAEKPTVTDKNTLPACSSTNSSEKPHEDTPSVLESKKLEKLVRKRLETIISPNMTQKEQAYAVYQYTNHSIKFTGNSKKGDWQQAAYDGLVQGRGDCYTYYAVSRAFLTVLGIQNIEVRRSGPTAEQDPHWWNLVNCGDGWYHFDACPHSKKFPFESFMFTDAEAEAYSIKRGNHYYDFDKDAYPPRETK